MGRYKADEVQWVYGTQHRAVFVLVSNAYRGEPALANGVPKNPTCSSTYKALRVYMVKQLK